MLCPSEVLPTPGRTDETQDGTASLGIELAHRQEFENAALHFLEPVMILIQDRARAVDVELFRIELRPRHRDQPVEIIARHGIFRGALRHALETRELALRLLVRFRGHRRVGDGLAQILDLRAGITLVAELFLDLAQALAQHRLFLPLIKRLARALIDLARHLEHLDAPVQEREHPIQALLEIEGRQDLLFLRHLQVHEARDDIGKRRGRLDGADRIAELGRRLGQQLQGFDGTLAQRERARLDVLVDRRRLLVRLDARHQERLAAHIVEHRETLLALRDQVMGAVGRGHEAHDGSDRAHAVKLLGVGILTLRRLQQDAHLALRAHRFLRGGERALAEDRDRQYHAGKQHRIGRGQDDEHVLGYGGRRGGRQGGCVFVHRVVPVKRRKR